MLAAKEEDFKNFSGCSQPSELSSELFYMAQGTLYSLIIQKHGRGTGLNDNATSSFLNHFFMVKKEVAHSKYSSLDYHSQQTTRIS